MKEAKTHAVSTHTIQQSLVIGEILSFGYLWLFRFLVQFLDHYIHMRFALQYFFE